MSREQDDNLKKIYSLIILVIGWVGLIAIIFTLAVLFLGDVSNNALSTASLNVLDNPTSGSWLISLMHYS